MQVEDLERTLLRSGVDTGDRITLDDQTYHCVTEEWITKELLPSWDRAVRVLFPDGYKADAADCDNFGRRFVQHCQDCQRVYSERLDGQLAVFALQYVPDSGHQSHLICMLPVYEPEVKDWRLLWVEPQPPSHIVTLTAKEKRSCSLIVQPVQG